MKIRNHKLILPLLAMLALSGCAAQQAISSVMNLRSGFQAYHAYEGAKSDANGDPVFKGYAGIVALATLHPRDAKTAAEVQTAFVSDLKYALQYDVKTVSAPLSVCDTTAQCSSRTMVVQFIETAYGTEGGALGLADKLSVGDKLRGKLDFSDAATGKLIAERQIEEQADYAGVIHAIQTAVIVPLMRSFPTDGDTMQTQANQLSNFDPVAPGYSSILGAS